MPKKIKKVKKVKKIKKVKKVKKKSKNLVEKKNKDISLTKKPGSFSSEEKVEIKKIKKQPTEKKQFNIKDFVVYPKHGVGKIIAVEKATIGQIDIQFYKIFIEKEKLTLTVPINQQFNLRPIASSNQINKCISILKSKPKVKRTMWSRRAQEYDQKINSGKIYELAEVVRDLNKNTDIIADQSYSERQLFEKSYERLKSEFEAVLKTTPEEVQKKMDKALGRNQNLTEVE
jgi:CarD family transcriptional regulator